MATEATLYLIRGIPGSGKSTLAKKIFSTLASAAHFEADMYFVKDGVYQFDVTKLRYAHQWCQEQTAQCLMYGVSTIVSNTFTTIKELRPYFEMAYAFTGKPPVVYLAQNEFQNVHDVPSEKLLDMKKRFVYDISSLFIDPRKTENDDSTG